MLIQIAPDSEVPIYTQLTNQIIEGIARGELQAGDSLPSVRALAGDLGVNMHTVNKSYHQLERKGIIRIQAKSGAVIATPAPLGDNDVGKLAEAFRPLIAECLVRGMTEADIRKLIQSIIRDLMVRRGG
jgi:GntR family transcriptional regulator